MLYHLNKCGHKKLSICEPLTTYYLKKQGGISDMAIFWHWLKNGVKEDNRCLLIMVTVTKFQTLQIATPNFLQLIFFHIEKP